MGALALAVLVVGCDEPDGASTRAPAPRPVPSPEAPAERPAVAPPVMPRETTPCEDVTEESTPDGAVRLRFDRVRVGMSPTVCGRVTGPSDQLAFTRYLQDHLRREPGCGGCQINRVDLVVLLDVTLDLKGRWRTIGSFGERDFVTYMPDPFDPTASPDVELEHAHFYFLREGEGYEAFLDRLCPGFEDDPDALLPRIVSDDCKRFTEEPAPYMRRPGLLEEEP